jgi:glucose-1-phosphate cytidylyltransferase
VIQSAAVVADLTTLVLCGGKGMRAYPHTLDVPKPLLPVAGRPVLAHVLDIYADHGLTRFVLAAGYKGELIEAFAGELPSTWDVVVVDTGEDTNTGARIAKCVEYVGDNFMATYADGLGDVDLNALQAFHQSHSGAATLTTVPLPSPYGTVDVAAHGRVNRMREKPKLSDHRINAGFFVFDRRVFDLWDGEDLEREVLPGLADRGELYAYEHGGFWKSMDTYKDSQDLSELCMGDAPPWRNPRR